MKASYIDIIGIGTIIAVMFMLMPSTKNPCAEPVTFRYGAGAAVALLGATIFLLRGVADGQASVVVPIAQMGFIIAALLGICLLGERLTIRKTIGLVSALAALGVLATSID